MKSLPARRRDGSVNIVVESLRGVLVEGRNFPGIVLPCRLLGVLRVEQNRKMLPGRERNDRMLAIPVGASALETIRSIGDLPPRVCEELERFFENAVAFERKNLRLLGWGEAADAEALLSASLAQIIHE